VAIVASKKEMDFVAMAVPAGSPSGMGEDT
jgi:hypothetical protein